MQLISYRTFAGGIHKTATLWWGKDVGCGVTIVRGVGSDEAACRNALYAPSDTATLQAQIADLKQVNAVLGAQLTDMREQRDKWQSRAERVSLAAPC